MGFKVIRWKKKQHVFSRIENFSQGFSCEHKNSSAFLHIVASYIVIDVSKKLRVVKCSVKQSSTACNWTGRKYAPLERRLLLHTTLLNTLRTGDADLRF